MEPGMLPGMADSRQSMPQFSGNVTFYTKRCRKHPCLDTFGAVKQAQKTGTKDNDTWTVWLHSVIFRRDLLTHRGRVTHICVSKLTIIVSDNVLSPRWRQAIIWTIAAILLIRNLRTNFSEIFSEIHAFSLQKKAFENVVCKMASISSRPQCVKPRYASQRSDT